MSRDFEDTFGEIVRLSRSECRAYKLSSDGYT